jgi:GT2 family glycosyltransferase
MSERTSFRIVIPTKKNQQDFTKTTPYQTIIKNIKNGSDFSINLDIVFENRKGLSELYQEKLNKFEEDYIIFMHDDLEIHDSFVFEKLIKAHNLYDIIGLAGSISQDYTTDIPPVWHLSGNGPQNSRGIVGHYIPQSFGGAKTAHVNSMFFGPTPSEVVVIDGLFMSFRKQSIQNKNNIFDKDFSFHFYDMAACIKAIQNGLTIGVYPIFCIHYGLGEFNIDPLWHELAAKFKQKYGYIRTTI